jgi:hypothetical protein
VPGEFTELLNERPCPGCMKPKARGKTYLGKTKRDVAEVGREEGSESKKGKESVKKYLAGMALSHSRINSRRLRYLMKRTL